MTQARARFTTRSLMIAVALIGLNLAGAMATAKHYPKWSRQGRESSARPHPQVFKNWGVILTKEGRGLTQGRSFIFSYHSGKTEIGRGRYGTGRQRIERIVLRPPPPNILQIWSPLVASTSLTILVLVVPWERRALSRWAAQPDGTVPSPARRPCLWAAVKWLMIFAALAGLNLAAALYRGTPDPPDDELDSPIQSSADLLIKPDGAIEIRPLGKHMMMKPDGRYESRAFSGRLVVKADGRAESRPPLDGWALPAGYGVGGRILGTIVYRPDGSVVGYEGEPLRMQSRPHLIRPPMRSFIEMWWPVLVSASITAFVTIVSWRRIRREGVGRSGLRATKISI